MHSLPAPAASRTKAFPMLRHSLARLAASIATLLAVVAIAFILMHLAPGGPFDAERAIDPQTLQHLKALYGLDRPLPQQFGFYLWGLLHGDLGPSLRWRDFTVAALFARALPVSLTLGGEALIVALFGGVALGLIAAVRRHGLAARAVGAFALLAIAVPSFVIAPLLQLIFGLTLRSLPVGGWNDGAWQNQVLPVATLALPQMAVIARLLTAALGDVLRAPSISTLRAFGLPGRVVYAHALRGAFLPVLSYLGPMAANLLTGSVVVETVFGIPGIGRYFVFAALGRDYTLVLGTVIVVAALVIVFNVFVDVLYGWIDPRVRQD
ncbi:Oligopeptide transport system permease protein OppB [Methylovirgula sp. HY1]|nr:Oligopeptide transport system permease protein OppB [Methylovirgula sp. HY1]